MAEGVIKLSEAEKDILGSLLSTGKNIELALPDEMAPADVTKTLKQVCSMTGKVEIAGAKLKAILGRLLVIARKNPEVYTKLGYDNYSDFIDQEVVGKYRVSRSTLYEAKKIVEHFPGLPVERYGKIGSSNLMLLAKFTSQGDGGTAKLLDKAEEMSVEEFKEFVVSKGHLEEGETSGAAIRITGTKTKIRELEKFLKREDVHAVVESDDPLEIVLAATREVDGEWTSQGAEIMKDRANKKGVEVTENA